MDSTQNQKSKAINNICQKFSFFSWYTKELGGQSCFKNIYCIFGKNKENKFYFFNNELSEVINNLAIAKLPKSAQIYGKFKCMTKNSFQFFKWSLNLI